jgi:serine/threonine-protein kinase
MALALPPVEACRDPHRILAEPTLPADADVAAEVAAIRAELEHARVQRSAGRYDVAYASAEGLLERARATGYDPVVAEVLGVRGGVDSRRGNFEAGQASLREAVVLAGGEHHDAFAADAAADLVFVLGSELRRFDEARAWADVGEMFLRRSGGDDLIQRARLLGARANVDFADGRYDDAEPRMQAALAAWEELGDLRPLDVAVAAGNLGGLHAVRGRYDQALALHERALAIREQTLGPEHPDLAMSLSNLGIALDALQRYDEAEAALRRGLAIREAALGPGHPALASICGNLGTVLVHVRRDEEAAQFHARALAIREAAFGPDHPDVASSLSNLGNARNNQRRFDEAIALHRRALAIREAKLPADHVDMGNSLQNLGDVLRAAGQPEEAEPLLVRAIEVTQRALGEDHPAIATQYAALGTAQEDLGRPHDALESFRRALAIREKSSGGELDVATLHWRVGKLAWELDVEREAARGNIARALEESAGSGASDGARRKDIEAWLALHPDARPSAEREPDAARGD